MSKKNNRSSNAPGKDKKADRKAAKESKREAKRLKAASKLNARKTKTRSPAYYFVSDFIFWCAGAALYAVAVDCFTSPNDIAPGGVTGISTLLNYLFDLPIGIMIMIINIPILAAAFKVFGGRFIIRTIIGTALSSVFIDLGALFLPEYTGDKLLAALFGGAFSGIGLGLVFLRGATTGGTDIIGRLLKLRFPHKSLGSFILVADASVMLMAGIVYGNIESMLYTAIVFFVSSKAIDYVVYGAGKSTLLLIITKLGDIIPPKIISEVGRGVTILPVKGAFTGEEKQMLMTVARPNEVAKINRIVKTADPEAFVIMTEAGEVLGNGFKTDERDI